MDRLDIPLPASHPAGHGLLSIAGRTEGGIIVEAEVVTGLMHRGAEKLFESRDYRQILSLANRHNWLASFDGELSAARVMESALGIVVPPRADRLRALLSEVCRMNHHLYWLGETVAALGGDADALRAARAGVTAALDLYSGARMHLMVVRVGGLSLDVSGDWLADLPGLMDACRAASDDCLVPVTDRLAGLAVLPAKTARAYATSGVVARASGWDRDLRMGSPGPWRIVTGTTGDALARLRCLADEVAVSADVAQALSTTLPVGPLDVRLPRGLRLPEGEYYGASETPAGVNGWWIVSHAETMPYRMKMRTASFNNAQALGACLPGTRVIDLPVALMSFFLVAGDIDK